MTDRFAMDSILILLRNSTWRVLGSDGQICNGFYIDFIKNAIGSDRQICNGFYNDFIKKFNLESPRLRQTDLQWVLC